jgi:hypothetical protein
MMQHKKIITGILASLFSMSMFGQSMERSVQNRPYTDLRPLHFGIVIGANFQDMKFQNVGPQTLTLKDGSQMESNVVCDQNNWDPGFNVGVLMEARLNEYFAFRLAPQMYFGTRNLVFRNLQQSQTDGTTVEERQSLKTVYIGANLDIIFASKRFNNHRPYMMAGIAPMMNLTTKASNYIQMKKADVFAEVGIGCDFYLPFFKLRPELKFMMGLSNCFNSKHIEDMNNADEMPYAASVKGAKSKMLVLLFYFE